MRIQGLLDSKYEFISDGGNVVYKISEEAEIFYLRARYYDPRIGRFLKEDVHWNNVNSIYGDNPTKINERENALGIKTYSYVSSIEAIMQSGNLYVYCICNPIFFSDPTGCYDRKAAVEYARTWGEAKASSYIGTPYERFDTLSAFITSFGRMRGDCANFVSQCLVAGGLDMDVDGGWFYSKRHVESVGDIGNHRRVVGRQMGAAWAQANAQYFYMSNPANNICCATNGALYARTYEELINLAVKYEIQEGDLLYWDFNGDGIMDHATIISGVSNDAIYFSGHTIDRVDKPVRKVLKAYLEQGKNVIIGIVRIRDDA